MGRRLRWCWWLWGEAACRLLHWMFLHWKEQELRLSWWGRLMSPVLRCPTGKFELNGITGNQTDRNRTLVSRNLSITKSIIRTDWQIPKKRTQVGGFLLLKNDCRLCDNLRFHRPLTAIHGLFVQTTLKTFPFFRKYNFLITSREGNPPRGRTGKRFTTWSSSMIFTL